MTDELEVDYHDRVHEWLEESFANVRHEPLLASGREPDFLALTPFESYVVEVENGTSNAELYNGLGQCLVYADEAEADPILVLPAGHGYDDPSRFGPVRVVTV